MIQLDKKFRYSERGSSLSTEIIGGATTYMTLAYIAFVQPVVLSAAGMDFGAVLTATCIGSALACFLMGFLANYPIALAPAMGHNFYFAFTVVLGMNISWQAALAATFVAGILFLLFSAAGLRQKIIHSLPTSLMSAIGCGIGLLIALIGFKWSGIIVDHPGTLVGLGRLSSPPVLLSLFGLTVMSVLLVRNIPGAILIGIISSAIVGVFTDMIQYQGFVSIPPSLSPTVFKLDFNSLLSPEMLIVIGVLFFLDVFDTIGTLVAIAPEAGMIKDGKVDINDKALLADASGTVIGSLLGTSTITSYVESATGIQSGARTGLAAITAGTLLLITPIFYPLIQMVGGGVTIADAAPFYPVTAPALIIVGVMMMKAACNIEWHEPAEAIPAFLTIIVMPLTVSITEGIAFGLISYSVLSVFRGAAKHTPWPLHLCALLLLLRYIFLV